MTCILLWRPQLSDVKQQLRAATEALENERSQHAISVELAATKEAAAAQTMAELLQARETIAIGTDLLVASQANETQSAIDLEALRTQNEALALAVRTAETNQRRDADAHSQVLHTWGEGQMNWVQ